MENQKTNDDLTAQGVEVKPKVRMPKIEIIPVEGRNGLYRIEVDDGGKSLSIPEISGILRKPVPKIKRSKKMKKKTKTEEIQYLGKMLTATTEKDTTRIKSIAERLLELAS